MITVDGSERTLQAKGQDLHETITKVRKLLRGALISCHDCRMLRNAFLVILDSIIPPEEEAPIREVSAPMIRAHSNVVINEEVSQVERPDEGVAIRQEKSKQIL